MNAQLSNCLACETAFKLTISRAPHSKAKYTYFLCLNDWLSRPVYGRMGGMDAKTHDNILSINDLEYLSTADLRMAYETYIHTPPPRRASTDFLRGNIAWALQARETRKSPRTLRQELLTKTNRAGAQRNHPCKTGTRLIREWQGQTYEVAVIEAGYLWQGEHYRSLSRIAREITGTRWSGPRFFGLKDTSDG